MTRPTVEQSTPHGIDYGDRLRIGVIVPSGNVVAEPEIGAMLPRGTACYVTRLELRGSSAAELETMSRGLEPASRLLADAQVDVVVFHCTAASTTSPTSGRDLRTRIEAAVGLPAVVTSEAIVGALHALRSQRVVLLTPYIDAVHAAELELLRNEGFDVVGEAALGIDTNREMASIPVPDLREFVLRNRSADAEAYLVSCSAVLTGGLIGVLEDELDRPVVTSTQAMVWSALRRGGFDERVDGYGRLLHLPGGPPER